MATAKVSANVFNTLTTGLTTHAVVKPVFSTATPNAAVKYSEPVILEAIHFNETTREIRAVGSDGNVRICKVDRLESIEYARTLWTTLKANKGQEVMFMAAGGFNPNRWFFDITK